MPRIRTVKPEFFRHRRLFLAERDSALPLRLAFAGLWCCADREGRFRWEPEVLKLDCLPFDDVDFAAVLDALAARGFIVRYASATDSAPDDDASGARGAPDNDASSTREFGHIPSWKKHQFINHREQASVLPAPPSGRSTRERPAADALSTRERRVTDTPGHARGEGEREGEKEKEKEKDSVSSLRSETPAPDGAASGVGQQEGSDMKPCAMPPVTEVTPELAEVADVRTTLFTEGLATVVRLSCRRELPMRTMIGKWLRDCDDDAAKVLAVIRTAAATPPAEPVAWIEAAIQERTDRRGATLAKVRERVAEIEAAKRQAETPPPKAPPGPEATPEPEAPVEPERTGEGSQDQGDDPWGNPRAVPR
jgi:hypothetical protein